MKSRQMIIVYMGQPSGNMSNILRIMYVDILGCVLFMKFFRKGAICYHLIIEIAETGEITWCDGELIIFIAKSNLSVSLR